MAIRIEGDVFKHFGKVKMCIFVLFSCFWEDLFTDLQQRVTGMV